MHIEELVFVLSNYTLSVETARRTLFLVLHWSQQATLCLMQAMALVVLLWCARQVYYVEIWFECAIRAHWLEANHAN